VTTSWWLDGSVELKVKMDGRRSGWNVESIDGWVNGS